MAACRAPGKDLEGPGWEEVLLMREKAIPGSVLGKVLSLQT